MKDTSFIDLIVGIVFGFTLRVLGNYAWEWGHAGKVWDFDNFLICLFLFLGSIFLMGVSVGVGPGRKDPDS